MVRLKKYLLRSIGFLWLVFIGGILPACPPELFAADISPPLLLSLDVEKNSDVESLSILNLQEPATYFVTGKFAQAFPETVRKLSLQGTIGSHSHEHLRMKELEIERIREDLLASSQAIQAVTGEAPVWFRAPFLEFSDDILNTAYELGFRYDSSMSERWVQQLAMSEFPISINSTGRILFSDYNIFSTYGFGSEMALDLLKENYLERASTGRPFVFLLHPSIIVEHKELLYRFIDFVKQQGGSCMTFDQYLKSFSGTQTVTLGIHLDPQSITVETDTIISDLKTLGVTDVILDMQNLSGPDSYEKPAEKQAVSNSTVLLLDTLKNNGFSIHGSVSALFHPFPVNPGSSADLMVDRAGKALPGWLAPSSPATRRLITDRITQLLKTYPLDGILLQNLSYPSLEYDYSPSALNQFIKDTSLLLSTKDPTTILTDYYNEWTSWRIAQLVEIAEESAAAIAQLNGSVQLSASLNPAALVNYRSMEISGQDYRLLANDLNFIIMDQQTSPASTPRLPYSDFTALSKAMVGERSVLISYPADENHNWTSLDFTDFLKDHAFSNSANLGVVLPEYNKYISKNDGAPPHIENLYRLMDEARISGRAMLAKTALETVQKMSPEPVPQPGSDQTSPEGLSFPVPEVAKQSSPAIGKSRNPEQPVKKLLPVSLGAGIVVLSIVLIASYRYRQSSLEKSLDLEKTAVIDWQQMDKSISKGEISGSLVHAVAKHLRKYDPVKVSKYRVGLILSIVANSEKRLSVDELINTDFDVPGWQILAMSHLKEALMHDYLKLSQDKIIITSKGLHEYESMKKIGFDPAQWTFTEKRLHENLVVACPYCTAENTAHWYWPNFTCSSCNQDVSFRECHTTIRKRPSAVELDQHQLS